MAAANDRLPEGAAAQDVAAHLLEATGLSQQIGFAMRFAQAAVWADLVAGLAPLALRPVQYSILLMLSQSPGGRQQVIGDALSIKRPNLVTLIDELEARGLVRRSAHPEDRRSHALYLTDAGQRLLADAEDVHQGHQRRLAAVLTEEERQTLLDMLGKLARL